MTLRRQWMTITLLLGVTAGAWAQTTPWQTDTRLDERVTVEAEGIPVRDLLACLSETAGVALTARGEVAEDKVIAFARGRRLRDVLDDLAALFDATWEKIPESKPARYELFLGQKARARDTALIREAVRRLAERTDEFVKALALTPEELARRPQDDLIRDYLGAPNNRTGLELYALLSPTQRETLWTARRLSVPYASLTPPQQQAVATVMRGIIGDMENRLRLNPHVKLPIPRMEDLFEGTVQFRVQRMSGSAILMLRLPGTRIPLGTADTNTGFLLPPHGDPYDPRHALAAGSLPAVPALQKAAGAGPTLADRLRRLAQDTGLPIMADFYRSRPLAKPTEEQAAKTEEPVEALDALCREPGYLWWRRGETLLFRKRDWFLQKRAEVPDSVLLALAESLKAAEGRASVEGLLRLRALTPAQVAGLNGLYAPLADETLLDGLGEMLALIAALPSHRADALFAESGLTLLPRDLTPAMRTALLRFMSARDILPNRDLPEALILRAVNTVRPASDPSAPGSTHVLLTWSLGRASGVYRLFLPHGLPDDRRDRTKVEKQDVGSRG